MVCSDVVRTVYIVAATIHKGLRKLDVCYYARCWVSAASIGTRKFNEIFME